MNIHPTVCTERAQWTSQKSSSRRLSYRGFAFVPWLCTMEVCVAIFFFFWLYCLAFGILGPWPGTEPAPLQWKHGIITTGSPEKSLHCSLWVSGFLTCKWGSWTSWLPQGPPTAGIQSQPWNKHQVTWMPHLHGPFLAGITGQAVTTK